MLCGPSWGETQHIAEWQQQVRYFEQLLSFWVILIHTEKPSFASSLTTLPKIHKRLFSWLNEQVRSTSGQFRKTVCQKLQVIFCMLL